MAKILYFIEGPIPTEEELHYAKQLSGEVTFRNAAGVTDDTHAIELCDGVAGKVPEVYAHRYPQAQTSMDKTREQLKKMRGE